MTNPIPPWHILLIVNNTNHKMLDATLQVSMPMKVTIRDKRGSGPDRVFFRKITESSRMHMSKSKTLGLMVVQAAAVLLEK